MGLEYLLFVEESPLVVFQEVLGYLGNEVLKDTLSEVSLPII